MNSTAGARDRDGVAHLLLIALGLAARVPLILAHPAVHGDDAVKRLAHSDALVLGYQLPLPQALVFVARALSPDLLWTRLSFALVGSLVPVALAAVVARTAGRLAGRTAGALLALHPLFVYYSIVPYQEGLMLLLLLAGALALLDGKEGGAGLATGLACLCRYEAWIAAAAAMLASLGRHRGLRTLPLRGPRALLLRGLRTLLVFGWAPLLWLAAWRGLSPPGTYVLDLDPEAGRLARLPFLFGKLREYSGDALLVLAAAGAVLAWRRRLRAWIWGAAFVALTMLAILGAGQEFPPGSGRVSERLAHVPAAALCALSGLALAHLAGEEEGRRATARAALAAAVFAAIALAWTRRTHALVEAANRDPSLRLALQVARAADAALQPGGRLLVAAPTVPPAAIEAFVRKVQRVGGDPDRAQAVARELSRQSADAERVAAHLSRPPGTVIPANRAQAEGDAPPELLAVFDDVPEAPRYRTGEVVARFADGGRAVTLYRLIGAGRRPRH